ncbi:PfkB family carbohydrate kinase [Streptomyces sp. NPDC001070]
MAGVGWARGGPSLVVLTRGAAGAVAHWAPGGRHSVPAHPVRVTDTIGAGDAFMAGLLAGLLSAGLLGGAAARERLRAAAHGGHLRPRWPPPWTSPRASRL